MLYYVSFIISLLSKKKKKWCNSDFMLQTRTVLRWQAFTVLPMKLRLSYTRPLLHLSKPAFWTFFGMQTEFVVYLFIQKFDFNPFSYPIISLHFMISLSIPTIVAMYFLPPHFIHSGVELSQTKLPMTKNLHLKLSRLSTWWWIAIMALFLLHLLSLDFNG